MSGGIVFLKPEDCKQVVDPLPWLLLIGAFQNEEEFVNGSLDDLRYKCKI